MEQRQNKTNTWQYNSTKGKYKLKIGTKRFQDMDWVPLGILK